MAPLEAEDASAPLGTEELPAPLGAKEAEGVVLIPDEAGAFLDACTDAARIDTISHGPGYWSHNCGSHHDLHLVVTLDGDPWWSEGNLGSQHSSGGRGGHDRWPCDLLLLSDVLFFLLMAAIGGRPLLQVLLDSIHQNHPHV